MSSMKYSIVILTIHRNVERITNIRKIMNSQGLKENEDYNFFYGIDFKNIQKNKLKYICKKGFKNICPYSTLACASSHILLWNHISQLKYDYVIILEDDTFINLDIFKTHKNNLEKLVLNNIIFLYSDCYYMSKSKYSCNNNLCSIFQSPLFHVSMACYIITPDIAKELFEYYNRYKIWFHIDFQMNFDIKNFKFDRCLYLAKNLCKQYGGNKSSMGIKHVSLFLYKLHDTKMYRIITTPIVRINDTELDLYILLMILILLILFFYYRELTVVSLILLFFIFYELFYFMYN